MVRPRVLVVEDELEILDLIKFNLMRLNYSVVGVTSGETALEAAHARPPDVVVLDIMLPGMDGLEVCRKLRQQGSTSQVPVIFVSARGEEGDVVRGMDAGANDYVRKPFSPRDLVSRIRRLVEAA